MNSRADSKRRCIVCERKLRWWNTGSGEIFKGQWVDTFQCYKKLAAAIDADLLSIYLDPELAIPMWGD